MARATPVVLDVDTGVDDACALLLAARHRRLDLRAVTCVAGNTGVDQVVRNTLKVLDAAGAGDVPVARGAERPLLDPPRDARHVHGGDGMGDLGLPPSSRAVDPRHAVELLRDVLLEAARAADPVTLIALAPLTNLALLLRVFPQALAGLRRLVWVGGGSGGGNVTAAAEFNAWHDPEAAAIVLEAVGSAGVPVTMYGLDVFYQVRVGRDRAERLAAMRHPAARLAGRLVAFQCERFGTPDATLGDTGAVCAVLAPSGLTTRALPVGLELGGRSSRGRTVVDLRELPGGRVNFGTPFGATTLDVGVGVDTVGYVDIWWDAVTEVAGGGLPRTPAGR
jgi:pyrimidine-specific ribonucleoside hydrolase